MTNVGEQVMTKHVERIRELINEDRRRTIYQLADTVGINYGVFPTENLNMRRIAPSSQHQNQTKHSTHNYTSNKGHNTQNEYNANTIYNYSKNNYNYN
jgi:hypothetical protein